MHVELLVEEPSAEAALHLLLHKILGGEVSFAIHAHQGKSDLLGKLPARLQAYRAWIPEDYRIVVLVDADNSDCAALKALLEAAARRARFTTKSRARSGGRFHVLNRLAVEELEAWFFGDLDAVNAAYPRVSPTLATKAKYRNPDAIKGGTWEALERELQRGGYHAGGLGKIAAARDIAAHMEPQRNRSKSFQAFRQGLLELV